MRRPATARVLQQPALGRGHRLVQLPQLLTLLFLLLHRSKESECRGVHSFAASPASTGDASEDTQAPGLDGATGRPGGRGAGRIPERGALSPPQGVARAVLLSLLPDPRVLLSPWRVVLLHRSRREPAAPPHEHAAATRRRRSRSPWHFMATARDKENSGRSGGCAGGCCWTIHSSKRIILVRGADLSESVFRQFLRESVFLFQVQ